MRKFNLSPNAYYNFKKKRNAEYELEKERILKRIEKIYHEHNGVLGHRQMRQFLKRENIFLSKPTVHKYMNRELNLKSIVRRKFSFM